VVRFGTVKGYDWKSVLDNLPSTVTNVSLSDTKDRVLPEDCQKILDTRPSLEYFELTGVSVRRQAKWKATIGAAEKVGINFVVDKDGNRDSNVGKQR
jgi:hypothetical protein